MIAVISIYVEKGLIIIFGPTLFSVFISAYSLVNPTGGALLRHLFDTHYSRLLGIANQILQNHADAEEVVSDVYFKIYETLNEYEGLPEIDTIKKITIITKHAAIDRQRNNNAQKNQKESLTYFGDDGIQKEFDIPDMNSNPEVMTITQERSRAVTAYIDALPEPDHTILMLKYKFGYRSLDIAKQLGMIRTQVDNRVSRAKEKIRNEFKEWDE